MQSQEARQHALRSELSSPLGSAPCLGPSTTALQQQLASLSLAHAPQLVGEGEGEGEGYGLEEEGALAGAPPRRQLALLDDAAADWQLVLRLLSPPCMQDAAASGAAAAITLVSWRLQQPALPPSPRSPNIVHLTWMHFVVAAACWIAS